MKEKSKTIASRVREAAKSLGEFCSAELVRADYDGYILPKRVHGALKDLVKSGEVERLEGRRTTDDGLLRYRYVGKEKPRTRLDIIWHLVRSHRQFDTDEMERLSGAARDTVLEYLHCLAGFGYIRKVRRGHWQMINDPGPATPVNTAKCARLKRLRKAQRA